MGWTIQGLINMFLVQSCIKGLPSYKKPWRGHPLFPPTCWDVACKGKYGGWGGGFCLILSFVLFLEVWVLTYFVITRSSREFQRKSPLLQPHSITDRSLTSPYSLQPSFHNRHRCWHSICVCLHYSTCPLSLSAVSHIFINFIFSLAHTHTHARRDTLSLPLSISFFFFLY